MTYPPLLGDSHGQYRIHIVGNSGIPHVSLDQLFWQSGWATTPPDEFRAKIETFMSEKKETGWIIDGEYTRRGGSIVSEHATDVIWLDPPLLLYFPRIVIRTFLRLFRLRAPCSPGCPERFREVFFSKDSILWWCLSQHWANARKWRAQMAIIGLGVGAAPPEQQKLRRIGGWGGQLKAWLQDVKELALARKRA
ncbi:adenylate kinase [Moniliophthora roreri]|uniref:Uncharacterized protein n=1 Tax=Moniliophthora roreri TaxID=221103 RepID=A0A0W0FBP8_MONRR|nr:adenylate kinase [Moniliophthora roreri]